MIQPQPAISIHAPHEGERQIRTAYKEIGKTFRSTLPTRGSDCICTATVATASNFDPRSPRGGATMQQHADSVSSRISIHAPHEGERRCRASSAWAKNYFNPRSPRGGATKHYDKGKRRCGVFQSTLPTRGSDTYNAALKATREIFQSTLPTRGSDAFGSRAICVANSISIHAPHEGERRKGIFRMALKDCISIHAPHEGERRNATGWIHNAINISIHAPHEGERQVTHWMPLPELPFRSTLPTRGSDARTRSGSL